VGYIERTKKGESEKRKYGARGMNNTNGNAE
jgi:hypothetical protein